jgi:ABC-type glutathione transport system ATPase component
MVCSLVVFLIICAKISQSAAMKKRYFGQDAPLIPVRVSEYFRKVDPLNRAEPQFQLNIYLYQAKLRDVTRFDPNRNEGFTGHIAAGKITGLMGGSGCGKSSLLDTIHGRRKLRSGSITFAAHDRLSNVLTDYIGYVPQADIMHEDLTVFETVYYSARTRRLDETKKVIKTDVSFVLEKLGLNGMDDSMIKTLSGGKKNHYE